MKSEKNFVLEDYLPYLVARIVPRLDEVYARHYGSFEMTREMFRVVMVLRAQGSMSLSELAAATSINLSTLSRLVGRMERRGLVSRRRVNGSRSIAIDLRPEGRRKAEALIPKSLKLEDRLTRAFTDAELRRCKNMLRRVYDAYVEVLQSTAGADRDVQRRRAGTTVRSPTPRRARAGRARPGR